jgi:hypothetical protein|tara:strand:- start:215 stop:1564 length:1350 start_codon:yes stop_codon:yes gene_type:complete
MPLLSTFGAASARSLGGIGGAAGGDSYWMTKIAYTSVYPGQLFYDSDNEFVIAMGAGGASGSVIQITLNASDGAYKSSNYPRLRVHDTGEQFSRAKICKISTGTYGYGMYNYNGSYEQGHLKTGDINFANGGNQIDVYKSGVYKGSFAQVVGDTSKLFVAFDQYAHPTTTIIAGRYNDQLAANSRAEKWDYNTGKIMYLRDMTGDEDSQFLNITRGTNTGYGEYTLTFMRVSGGYLDWSKQFRISNKSTQAGEQKSIAFLRNDKAVAVGHTEPSNYSEMFVVSLAYNGNVNFQKSYYSGSFHYYSHSVALDSSGNAYVCGFKQASPNRGIIMKLNSSGVFQWGIEVSASGNAVEIVGIDVDNNGNIYFSGYTTETDRKLIIGKIPDDGSTSGTYDSVTFASISMSTRDAPTTAESVSGTFNDGSNLLEQGTGDSQIDVFTATSTNTTTL